MSQQAGIFALLRRRRLKRPWPGGAEPETVLAAVLAAALAVPAAAQQLVVSPPARDFGYFAGDVFTSTVRIATPPGMRLDRASLPAAGAVTSALDLRAARLQRGGNGASATLSLTWQTWLTPEDAAQQTVPGFSLAVLDHGRRRLVAVGGFTIGVSAFRHDGGRVAGAAAIRPDRPIRLATPMVWPWLAAGAILAAAGAMMLAAWWPGRRAGPFGIAARRVRAARGDRAACLLALHRAFDSTAGARVMADDLDRFVAAHPAYQALRPQIAGFFAQSRHHFFGAPDPGGGPDPARLSRALAQAERGG